MLKNSVVVCKRTRDDVRVSQCAAAAAAVAAAGRTLGTAAQLWGPLVRETVDAARTERDLVINCRRSRVT